MQIENETLTIDAPIEESELEGFIATLSQKEITRIEVKTDDLSSAVIQALWCLQGEKEVVCERPLLAKFFETVRKEKVD